MFCPNCNSENVKIESVQENQGSTTISTTNSKTKEKRHGFFWWLFIGWWWKFIDLILWIVLFIPRALLHIGRRKKFVTKSTTAESTVNHIVYKKICTCQNCGHSWEIQ